MKDLLLEFRSRFDEQLDAFWDTKISHYHTLTTNRNLLDVLAYTKPVSHGGKRVRPFMAQLTSQRSLDDFTETEQGYLLAIELIHVFALIHDDIMDEAATRHNTSTIHEYVKTNLEANNRAGDLKFQGHMQAMLVGDLVFWLAGALVVPTPGRETEFATLRRYFTEVVEHVVMGQMLDFDTASRDHITDQELQEKTTNKTAYYTFVYPLLIGNYLAHAPEDDSLLTGIGKSIGFAYQIQDDLLDVLGTNPDKPHFQDVTNGQHTLMSQHVRQHGSTANKALLDALWRQPTSPESKVTLLQLFETSGAIDAAKAVAKAEFDQARTDIAKLRHSETARLLTELCNYLEHREY